MLVLEHMAKKNILLSSPPYDVERALLALGANLGANLLSQAGRFLLKLDEASNIIDQMEARVGATWYDVARAEGVTQRDCELIEGAFAYPGFRA